MCLFRTWGRGERNICRGELEIGMGKKRGEDLALLFLWLMFMLFRP